MIEETWLFEEWNGVQLFDGVTLLFMLFVGFWLLQIKFGCYLIAPHINYYVSKLLWFKNTDPKEYDLCFANSNFKINIPQCFQHESTREGWMKGFFNN